MLTSRRLNGRVADSVKRINDAIAKRQAVLAWAERYVPDCGLNCDDEGQITVEPFGDGERHLVPCPRLTQSCACGQRFISAIEQRALKALPADFPTTFRRNLIEPRGTRARLGAQRWDGKGFLYIYGGTGSGKSFAAAWRIYDDLRCRFMQDWDNPGLWYRHSTCRARWFSAFSVCIDRANLYEAEQAPMLVLDDLGCETEGSKANSAILNELIGVRYNFERPTIITSNIAPEELSRRYQPRMYERLMQSNHFVDAGMDSLRLD